MGLHDRINNKGSSTVTFDPLAAAQPTPQPAPEQRSVVDPYTELKTRIHHECIAKLGAELFKQTSDENLHESVMRTV